MNTYIQEAFNEIMDMPPIYRRKTKDDVLKTRLTADYHSRRQVLETIGSKLICKYLKRMERKYEG